MAKSVNGGGGGSGEDNGASSDSDSTTPICRCRVLYLGSAVPHITKDGLQGIQEPLKDLYPEQGVFWNADRDHCATGIDSWLSVWSNGILVENVDDKGNTVRRFHPIESLHYCAAVRYVSVPEQQQQKGGNSGNGESATNSNKVAKFLPLDSPFSKSGSSSLLDMGGGGAGHPPLFACILRRTSGIKVLECHAFICKKEAAANALVRCCFHAYADTMHARQIEMESPYEQLDKRRSRSIGSALDAQSLRSIDEKVTAWQKSSTGSSTTGGAGGSGEDNGTADAVALSRSISRQKARTPSLASLASHHQQVVNGEVNGHHHLNGHHQHGPQEPIYYNGIGNGTLRSVKSFISLATLRGSSKKQQQQQMRPRQIPMPMSALPPPPPVMFATLSKKQLKAMQKESTLKRKHKYKEGLPAPFLPNGPFGPMIFGPPPPPPHMMHPLYGPLPPPGPPPHHPGAYFTIDRKGRMVTGPAGPPLMHHGPPPPPPIMAAPSENGVINGGHLGDEPIYMPTLSSPNGTLMRPMTPHRGSLIPVEPIYGGGPPPHHPAHLPPHLAGPPPPPMTFIPHPQTGELVACTLIPTLSRKELKELEKAKAKLKKAAKKEKKQMKNGKGQMIPLPSAVQQQQQQLQLQHEQMVHEQMYQTGSGGRHQQGPPPPPPFPYAGEHPSLEQQQQQAAQLHHEEMLLREGHPQASFNSNSSSSAVGGIGGGIYKKKGHLNERAFSYSIRQEHRSRSNSLSNLAFDSPLPVHNGNGNGNGVQTPRNGNGEHNHQEMMTTTTTSSSNHASSVSLKSNHTGGENSGGGGKHHQQQQLHYNGEYNGGQVQHSHSNGHHHHHHQQPAENGGKHYQAQQQQMHNGGGGHHNGGRITASNGSLQALAAEHGIDPNVLASRMNNLKLNGGGTGAPPPPPLPPNGYHNGNAAYQKTATIKRL